MVTADNAKLNLATAARNVRAALGLSDTESDWTYDQRRGYNAQLAQEILRYPNSFTPEILAIAQRLTDPGALEDASFSWSAFAGETAANAVPVLSGFTTKLIIGAVIVAAVYWGVKAYVSKPATAS